MSNYTLENAAGDILDAGGTDDETSIARAREMLENDPELGEIIVMEWREVATVTHGPDANWNTQVVVLMPGEKIEAPDDSWKMPEDSGYDVSDPKHENFYSIHADLYDQREGK